MIIIIDIKQWMKGKLIKIKKDESIVNSAKLMSKTKVGSLIVVSNRKPIGIITQTDIIKRAVAKNKDLKTTKVKDIMTTKLITAPSNSTFTSLSAKMHKYKIKHIVIKDKDKVKGIITSTDIIRLMGGVK